MTYRSIDNVKELLEASGFEIVELNGTNLFSCVLPNVALSATYAPTKPKRHMANCYAC